MKFTQICDFYDFPMSVYARKNICIKMLGKFDYYQLPNKQVLVYQIAMLSS